MPTVSVLLPVYNTPEDFLRQAIESILHQTYTDFELLIINDASTIDVESVIKSYSDKRIKYFKNATNLGISGTRNLLLDKAAGKYLAIMDHDDISLPERLAREVEFLDQNPSVGVVSCRAQIIDSPEILNYPVSDQDIEFKILVNNCIVHPAAMIRRSVLEQYNIRYEKEFSPAEDYALWCRLLGKTEFHNLPDILFMYRDHPNNTSHRQAFRMAKATEAIQIFARRDNQALWNLIQKKYHRTTRIRLFNFLPLLTIHYAFNRCTINLLGIIPILSVKDKHAYHFKN